MEWLITFDRALCGGGGRAAAAVALLPQAQAAGGGRFQHAALEAGRAGFAGQCPVPAAPAQPPAPAATAGAGRRPGRAGRAGAGLEPGTGATLRSPDRPLGQHERHRCRAVSRLEAAKEQAKVLIESMRSGSALSLRDGSDHAMVIAFDQHAKVMCNFTSDKRQLTAAIDAIEPSDGPSRLARGGHGGPGLRPVARRGGQHPQRGRGRQAGPVQRRPHSGPGRHCGRARRACLPPHRAVAGQCRASRP